MRQTIRIIGGQFRGKKLHFPVVGGLRPTPDRVRETLFNWLMHDIGDARCLDAFSGSGAIGFEAFSRGASKVVLLEQEPNVYANLLKQASSFNSVKLIVRRTDTLEYLRQTSEQFDIVFLDPPFAKNYLPQCIELLANTNLLVRNGLVYVESSQEIILDKSIWEQVKLKQAGQVIYGLYKRC